MKISYKSLALALCFGTSVFGVFADNESGKLNVVSTNGSASGIDLLKIGKMTFGGGQLMIHMADGSKHAMDMKDIDRLTFDAEISTNGEKRIEAEVGEEIQILVENNMMTVTERNNKEISVMVFGSNGMQLLVAKGLGEVQVDFSRMTPGIYIIKANDRIIKYMK